MLLIVTYHLNKIRELVVYKTQVVSILGWYLVLVTTKPAISEIYDQIPQCLKVCNGNNSNTRMVLLAEKDPSSSRDISPTDPRRSLVL
jgi:hypothetical protein